jgi:alkanesulfonate monooxygenase SsuD/methylene tetrahydromethanopterin reductase-like flavin-dependent oxidoreductase (luciferase family)
MARRYIAGYFQSVLQHYEFAKPHLGNTSGYEYYGKIADRIAEVGEEKFIEFFMNLQVYGTPEACRERIAEVRRRLGSDSFIGVFSYHGMPREEAERNMRLFAAEVMPALKDLPPVGAPEQDVA